MKRSELDGALSAISDELIADAEKPNYAQSHEAKNKYREFFKKIKIKWTAPIATLLVIAVALGIILSSGKTVMRAYAVYTPDYPDIPSLANSLGVVAEKSDEWRAAKARQYEYYKTVGDGAAAFYKASVSQILSKTDSENEIYSPTSLFIALAMLTECTGAGELQEELLSLLGAESVEELRRLANALWLASFWDDGKSASRLASSVWLRDDTAYDKGVLSELADYYYASSFSGRFGSQSYTKAFREWLKSETGGLLNDQIDGMEFSADTVLALASTVYLEASWDGEFKASSSKDYSFESANGSVSHDFLTKTDGMAYFWGEKYSAVKSSFKDGGGSMYFILPDEGVSPEELMLDEEALDFIASGCQSQNSTALKVHLAVPRFDVSSQNDLASDLKELGVEGIFNPSCEYTLFDEEAYVNSVTHGARVAIDEEGCIAAAYTVIAMDGTAGPPSTDEIYFTVNRPFVFVITSGSGTPLFVGVVNNV